MEIRTGAIENGFIAAGRLPGHLILGSTESLMCSHGGQRVTKLHKNGTEQGDLFRRLAISDAAGKSRNKDSKFAGIHDITS